MADPTILGPALVLLLVGFSIGFALSGLLGRLALTLTGLALFFALLSGPSSVIEGWGSAVSEALIVNPPAIVTMLGGVALGVYCRASMRRKKLRI